MEDPLGIVDGIVDWFGRTPWADPGEAFGASSHVDVWQPDPPDDWFGKPQLKGWSPWRALGGKIVGSPSAVSLNKFGINVFARGIDDRLWQKWWAQGGGWSGWVRHEDQGFKLGSAPVVAVAGTESAQSVQIFVRGADGGCWVRTKYEQEGEWRLWHSLGAKLVGAPTVASAIVETGKVSQTSVFVRGVDNIVYEKTWTQTIGPDSIKEEWGNNWTPHESHWLEDGFKLDSSPAASYSGKGNEILLAANSDSGQPFVKKRRETSKQIHSKEADYELTTREWDRNWTPLGGKILDAPFAWWSSVYAEAPDGRLFQNHQNLEDGWSGWKADNDDFLLGAPPSVSSNYMDRCNVFARGKDGQLWAKRWVD